MKNEVLTKLWQHLLSLQKGFAFSGQKKRIVFENGECRYVDLEMYNIEIHSVVLINIRTGLPNAAETEQMQRLVDYYDKCERYPHENPAIGIVINKTKNDCYISYIGVTDKQKQLAERSLALHEFKG
ncbi:MAG: DUF1016 domain-containing protein [Clostridiales bacterium]|jgi:hypothetical protein|nr:DUF1016 domain-containing protein [Clostridiales bacterium]